MNRLTIWGELVVQVRTEQHNGTDMSCRVTFQGAKVHFFFFNAMT